MSEQVTVAIINTAGPVFAALLGGFAAWLARRMNSRRKEIIADLQVAVDDIQFLLEVERIYGEELKFHADSSMRNSIRERVRTEKGFKWSGRYTPGRVREYANQKREG